MLQLDYEVKSGFYLSNKRRKLAYIPVYKNASSWGVHNLQKCCRMSRKDNRTQNTLVDYKIIFFIREPLKRWISGISQYLYDEHPDILRYENFTPLWDMIFTGVIFDTHTYTLDMCIHHSLKFEQFVFFDIDEPDFNECLNSFLIDNKYSKISTYEKMNTSNSIPKKYAIQELVKKKLYSNKKYLNNVKLRLDKDFLLWHRYRDTK